MMDLWIVYFPIAETAVSLLLIMSIGLISGLFSGLLGVGGGFISTPLLIMSGITPAVAVATSAHQIVGASFSGVLARMKRKNFDLRIGVFLAMSGLFGSSAGVYSFNALKSSGKVDFIISILYMVIMGLTSLLIFTASMRRWYRARVFKKTGIRPNKKDGVFVSLVQKLPFRIKAKGCEADVSVLVLAFIGCVVGFLSALMGVGGGFIVVPLLAYVLKMPNNFAIGTSLVQIFIVSMFIVISHIFTTGSLDLILGAVLIFGAVCGAQIGSTISMKVSHGLLLNFILSFVLFVIASIFLYFLLMPYSMYEVKIA